jgi:DNA-binding PadR family transcriptional regulator
MHEQKCSLRSASGSLLQSPTTSEETLRAVRSYEMDSMTGSRLYPNLDDLVDKGLLEKGELDKRTNVYTVTKRGLRELEARRAWEDEYIESTEELTTSA